MGKTGTGEVPHESGHDTLQCEHVHQTNSFSQIPCIAFTTGTCMLRTAPGLMLGNVNLCSYREAATFAHEST